MNTEVIMYMLLGTSILCGLVTILVLLRCSGMEKEMHRMRKDMSESVNQSFSTFGEMVSANQKMMAENMDSRLFDLNNRFSHMAVENEQKLEAIRGTMEKKITDLTADNNRQLKELRQTVDE